jgi:hypothetical protein
VLYLPLEGSGKGTLSSLLFFPNICDFPFSILMNDMMPKLEEERVYHREEVAEYIGTQSGTSDFTVAELHFPRNLQTWEHDGTAWRDREEVFLQYKVFAIEGFKEQISALETDYMKKSGERERVRFIVETLEKGNPFFPVLIQKNDHRRRIIEGHHRSIALLWLESNFLPAFLLGYKNWFTEDELRHLNGVETGTQLGFPRFPTFVRAAAWVAELLTWTVKCSGEWMVDSG